MKFKILFLIAGLFLLLFLFRAYGAINAPDLQCKGLHATNLRPPLTTKVAQDFLVLGDYHYDIGSCKQAVVDYTRAIQFDPNFTKAYNNRAYANMRMQNYKIALDDLNKAIELDPNYVTALMNRGDIYNYYYAIDKKKAIADYDRVITLGIGKDKSKSVCGHKAMAETNGMVPLAILKVILGDACE